ncbi:hypothetical protein IID24_02705 [Patescibacteria group bacterium]|nr:hypothetical protein [Patescibacteria group bacterium]
MAKRSRLDFLAYVKRTFKRTDKNDEIYEFLDETTDELSTIFPFDIQKERWTVSLVTNQYDYTLPDNFGLVCGGVVFIDSAGSSKKLHKLSKEEFDRAYPDIEASDFAKDDPEDYVIYGNQILIAPYLSTISSEVLEISASEIQTRLSADNSTTDFNQWWEAVIKHGVLEKLYHSLEFWEASNQHKAKYGEGISRMAEADKANTIGLEQVEYTDF